jgi:hypothetical protein
VVVVAAGIHLGRIILQSLLDASCISFHQGIEYELDGIDIDCECNVTPSLL